MSASTERKGKSFTDLYEFLDHVEDCMGFCETAEALAALLGVEVDFPDVETTEVVIYEKE